MKKSTLQRPTYFSIILLVAAAITLAIWYNASLSRSAKNAENLLISCAQQQIIDLKSGNVAVMDAFAAELGTKPSLDSAEVLNSSHLVQAMLGMYDVAYVDSLGSLHSTQGFSATVNNSEYFKSTMNGERFAGKISDISFYKDKIAFTSPIYSQGKPAGLVLSVYEPAAFLAHRSAPCRTPQGRFLCLPQMQTGPCLLLSTAKPLSFPGIKALTSFFLTQSSARKRYPRLKAMSMPQR